MAKLTLDDIERTPLGQQIVAEREAQAAADAALAEERRQGNVALWQGRLAALAPEYEALRQETLGLLAQVGPRARRLVELRQQLREFASFITKNGGQPEGLPEPTTVAAMRAATDQVREILGDLGGAL